MTHFSQEALVWGDRKRALDSLSAWELSAIDPEGTEWPTFVAVPGYLHRDCGPLPGVSVEQQLARIIDNFCVVELVD